MAVDITKQPAGRLGRALVDFSLDSAFPDEDVSLLPVAAEELPSAISALVEAKTKLEAEIHTINEETADDVRTWRANAKSLQDDIARSKALGNDIIRQSETPAVSGQRIQETEEQAAFLVRELNYNDQVREVLKSIKSLNQVLDRVEHAANERRILDALHLLEKFWTELDAISLNRSTRVLKLLQVRSFELKSSVHEVLDHVWATLVRVDTDQKTVSVFKSRDDEPMSLSDAVIGLKAYKELNERVKQLWHDINTAIVQPRLDIRSKDIRSVDVENETLKVSGTADSSIDALLKDLEIVFSYLSSTLPQELVETMSSVMMSDVISQLVTVWLDSAIPSSLEEMDEFQAVIAAAKSFSETLTSLGFSGLEELQEWVESAPRVWLSKRRETTLDTVRLKLSQGLGASKQIERVEKQMVSRAEGREIAANNAAAAAATAEDDDWGAAWGEEEEEQPAQPIEPAHQPVAPVQEATTNDDDDGADAWDAWGEEAATAEETAEDAEGPDANTANTEEDDPSEAWGWGDEGNQEEPEPAHTVTHPPAERTAAAPLQSAEPQTRELTLKETYNISSLPEPVLSLIFAIVDDGASLTEASFENSPVSAAAAGLFSLPTLALAMFRATSPYYYSLHTGGNMYLYNDATYLSERLADFGADWKTRSGLTTRAQNMLRLDNDVKSLHSFANRAYSNEMNSQKTIIRDLLGGAQNVMTQDETESCVESAVAHVRSIAGTWEAILTRSAWCQAVGSLIDALSTKLISDVLDMPSIGQEEAYNIAKLIALATELDNLFLPSRLQGKKPQPDEIPSTAQYAASWLRLKYLSEVLQSNLKEVRFLWIESELSLYFTADEVLDLINLSFEDNPRTREVIKEITSNRHPMGEEEQENW